MIVTATKSGFEQNFARFGQHLADALADAAADLDGDGQTSLLEAYLTASRATAEFYRQSGRLATEHALLEDTGDGLAMPADWYRGVRPAQKPAGPLSVGWCGRFMHGDDHAAISGQGSEAHPLIRASSAYDYGLRRVAGRGDLVGMSRMESLR